LQAKLQDKLVQDRNASNSIESKTCWGCGAMGVIRGHTGCTKELVNSGGNPRKAKHRLDNATNLKVVEAIKKKTIPANHGSIPDSAKFDILILTGKPSPSAVPIAADSPKPTISTTPANIQEGLAILPTLELQLLLLTLHLQKKNALIMSLPLQTISGLFINATDESEDEDIQVVDSDQFIQHHNVPYGFGLVPSCTDSPT